MPRWWPVLSLLLLVVLVPAACVLWLMGEAVRNERLAVQQKLTEIYRGQLRGVERQIASYWHGRAVDLDRVMPESSAAARFAALVQTGSVTSAVIYDADGRLLYPAPASPSAIASGKWQVAWRRAEGREAKDPAAAAAAYGDIASSAEDPRVAALAMQAQARCLVRVDRLGEALEILSQRLADERYLSTVDGEGRLTAANALLRALELAAGEAHHAAFERAAHLLGERLADYQRIVMPAAQRRFLMRQLSRLTAADAAFGTLSAEDLAARYLDTRPAARGVAVVEASGLAQIWRLASPTGEVLALYAEERVVAESQKLVDFMNVPGESEVRLLPPSAEVDPSPLIEIAASEQLPGWRLALHLREENPFTVAAGQQISTYRGIAALGVVILASLVALTAHLIRREMKLTGLKNDLLATVTHELKTPLASMRLLVDTLLSGGMREPRRLREYLELIGRENARLSRLVDNFLTFSRMERDKVAFAKVEVDPEDILRQAVDAIGERFAEQGAELHVEAEPDLPPIEVDIDAMVTVLLNLLDNAYKYSPADRRVSMRVHGEGGEVCFSVSDRGIGMSRRQLRRIFDRFYQVDRHLSRSGSGCGLGLAIVRHIIGAHGGRINVESRLEQGSTFTVRLPVLSAAVVEGTREVTA